MALQVDDRARPQSWTVAEYRRWARRDCRCRCRLLGPESVRNALQSQFTRLIAVCDADLARARTVVGDYLDIEATDDLSAILDDQSVEAVAIATPAGTHVDVAMAAVRRASMSSSRSRSPPTTTKVSRSSERPFSAASS